jgi:hypothetical protein
LPGSWKLPEEEYRGRRACLVHAGRAHTLKLALQEEIAGIKWDAGSTVLSSTEQIKHEPLD